ncbi:MAG: thermonuclease family protein [Pseudomonadota bacterium]
MEILLILVVLAGVVAIIYFGKRSSEGHDNLDQPTSYDAVEVGRRSFKTPIAPRLPREFVVKGSAYVSDGDSLIINKIQIRLFGIDAPELNHPYGKNAKWALVALCKGMTIHAHIIGQDTHGRNVAKCYLQDGTDLSAEMVKLGLAIDWPKFSGGVYGALELPGIRKKLWLADARQKGRMHVWQQFEAKQNSSASQ